MLSPALQKKHPPGSSVGRQNENSATCTLSFIPRYKASESRTTASTRFGSFLDKSCDVPRLKTSQSNFKKKNCYCIYLLVCVCVRASGGPRTTYRSQFSPSTLGVPGTRTQAARLGRKRLDSESPPAGRSPAGPAPAAKRRPNPVPGCR